MGVCVGVCVSMCVCDIFVNVIDKALLSLHRLDGLLRVQMQGSNSGNI